MRSLRLLFPMVTRALPLLLLFMTFLFINAEVWQVSATLDGGVLWLIVLLFSVIARRVPARPAAGGARPTSTTRSRRRAWSSVCRGTPLAKYAQSGWSRTTSVERLAERPKVHGLRVRPTCSWS